jgi:hypothetical protein
VVAEVEWAQSGNGDLSFGQPHPPPPSIWLSRDRRHPRASYGHRPDGVSQLDWQIRILPGHYLTSADATPCKINATRAIGVRRTTGATRCQNPLARHAQRLTDEQVSSLEVIEARGQTAERLAWPHRGRPVSGDPVDRLMTPN